MSDRPAAITRRARLLRVVMSGLRDRHDMQHEQRRVFEVAESTP
ncbi:MAG TPA: hypothetical protein VGE12_03430 [Noviherbaspirillum sp.]